MSTPTQSSPVRTTTPTADPVPATRSTRLAGAALIVGTLAFAAAAYAGEGTSDLVDALCGVFQIGVWGVLLTMWRTGATGTSRLARNMIAVEMVLLAIASLATLLMMLPEPLGSSPPVMVVDLFWPISMLGMAVLGIKVAVAGVWRGPLRVWPAVAETWVLFAVPALLLLGDSGRVVGTVHLLVGYLVLGVLLLVRPDLTRR